MNYTNSSLITDKVNFGTKNSNKRDQYYSDTKRVYNPSGAITKISIHHMAGKMKAKACAQMHYKSNGSSANYYIGYDGEICLGVDESRRAWTSGDRECDSYAITIEVSNDINKAPWSVSDKSYDSLIKLVADICKRNEIEQLEFTGDKSGNLVMHRWYRSTACIPVNSELLTENGWVKLSDIKIGDKIACSHIDNLDITFEEVYGKVEEKQQDTYTNNGITATKDHRMVYCTQGNRNFRIDFFNKLLSENGIYIPMAGSFNGCGMKVSDEMLVFLIAVQADGCYMRDTAQSTSYYGLEFHLKKQRKIERIKGILESLNFEYSETKKSDGSTSIRIYNQDDINIVNDICECYLDKKMFSWQFLNLSKEQAKLFLNEILFWDGCLTAKKYSSTKKQNLDVVSAISALNNVGSYLKGNDVFFRDTPFITLVDKTTRNVKSEGREITKVSCVSVKTGIILIRQNGKTFIVGNCPGDYLANRFPDIARKVNALLKGENETTSTSNNVLYAVQVGAFANKTNADKLCNELRNKGYNPIIVSKQK